MATEDGRSDPAVDAALSASPFRFGFFQAVRLLRLFLRRKGLQPVIGVRELIRFRTPRSLEFPASEIQSLEKKQLPLTLGGEEVDVHEMTVNFMGLTGPSGVLPHHYTETLIAGQQHYRQSLPVPGIDMAPHRFLDIFSHRSIALFASAWRKYRFWLKYEEGDRGGVTRYLLDIVGLGTDRLRSRLRDAHGNGLPDETIAYYSGLLSQHPYSCNAITAVLADYFGTSVVIEQFKGRWLQLPEDAKTNLGTRNAVLGENAVLGSRAWDQQSKFRIRMGPLERSQFEDLLPYGKGYAALIQLAKFLAGVGLDFEVQLILKKDQVPACVLDARGIVGGRLGWSSWLRRQKPGKREPIAFDRDADDVVLAP